MTVEICGFCDERFLPLKDAFRANFDDGLELGASLALTHQGRTVVDLWAGWADRKQTRPWEKDTIVLVYSTTKIMTIIATLMVVDRGLLELDAPIALYWPEFAKGGKAGVTVRDALTHQAGVPGFIPPVPFEALYEWDAITADIAAEPHWFDGRRVTCYHAITYGFVLGELIRRVDGRMPGVFFAEEIAGKVGADFHIGLKSRSDFDRVAGLQHPGVAPSFPKGSLYDRVFTSVGPGGRLTWEYLSAEIPAGNGCGNGRSIARVCAIMAMGGALDGMRYLSRRMVEEAAAEQVQAEDSYLGSIRLGLGFGLHIETFPAPSPTSIHWGGYGGSWGLMDPKAGVSLGYAPNNMVADFSSTMKLDRRIARFTTALETVLSEL